MTDTKSLPEAQVPEMVERVKRAIRDRFTPAIDFEAPYAKFMLDAAARAAMAAMVEPTADMVETGEAGIAANLGAANVWRGMMTAALDG